ncbi:MAG: MarR family winged helix-turn-helix transcriptional regulator [Pseudorhodobacter sp.]
MSKDECDPVNRGSGKTDNFVLADFFPYQTRVFYKHVSQSVSRIYETRYGMKPYEWRTIAILGRDRALTAAQVVELSSIDKVSVSRAVSALRKRGWIIEKTNRKDGRSKMLQLSVAGIAAYDRLVPEMLAMERNLLAPLDSAEIAELRRLMEKVRLAGMAE